MPTLVGDLVIAARDLMPDPCLSLSPPNITLLGYSTSTSPPTLFSAGQTVYLQATQGNQWGETAPIAEFTVTNAGGFNVIAVVPTSYLATFVRVYFTTAGAGLEDQYVEVDISTPTNSVIVTISPAATIGQGVPPTISRAWLPESDGQILSATRLYQWLKEGRDLIGNLSGGIRDITGIPSTNGQAQYQMVGNWMAIDNNFYDGYPVAQGTKQQIFRHNSVKGLSGVVTMNTSADRQIAELWPQSDRTAGSALLNGAITSTATSITIDNQSGFVLPFGLLLIGTYPPTAQTGPNSCELVYYSNLGSTTISQLTRGLGGTFAQAWADDTPVTEVNIYLTGKRFPQVYSKGQSALTVTDPPGFAEAMKTYLLYRFKDAEQNVQEAKAKYDLLTTICMGLMKTQQPNGPRQIQIGGTGGVEIAVGLGSVFGGVIIP